jgi:predicted PolB exonuclease-like 3'-5' exonuclease
MRFTVYAFSTVPDLETARKNFGLHDLSDKDVAKVLFHQRKQHTGHSESLNWDQQMIASVSLVKSSLDYVDMATYSLADSGESNLIDWFYKAMGMSGRMVSWDGNTRSLPLLHFRCMKHRISNSAWWDGVTSGQQLHVDLRELIAPAGVEAPPLDAMARRFHFPGMLGASEDAVTDAYLANDFAEVTRYSDMQALNTYLLALEVLALRGEMSYADAARARLKLRAYLERHADKPTPSAFLANWDETE